MRILIAAIGRMKSGPMQVLMEEYLSRLPSNWPVEIRELEAKATLPPTRRIEEEGKLLLACAGDSEFRVALDERGSSLTSQQFAARMERCMQDSMNVAFFIGGADGLSNAVRQKAQLVLSFGSPTWPHMLARVMLAEQLYRAHSIVAGHPYHRG